MHIIGTLTTPATAAQTGERVAFQISRVADSLATRSRSCENARAKAYFPWRNRRTKKKKSMRVLQQPGVVSVCTEAG